MYYIASTVKRVQKQHNVRGWFLMAHSVYVYNCISGMSAEFIMYN